jgi:hypothetical protein
LDPLDAAVLDHYAGVRLRVASGAVEKRGILEDNRHGN